MCPFIEDVLEEQKNNVWDVPSTDEPKKRSHG